MIDSMYTVGELAERMRVSVRTLQFYDKRGLLKPSAYSEGGRRLYDAHDVIKLQQILSLKYLGLPLGEIKQYLSDPDHEIEIKDLIARQIAFLEKQKVAIDDALAALRVIEQESIESASADFERVAHAIFTLRLVEEGTWVSFFDFEGDGEKSLKAHIEKRWESDQNFPLRLAQQFERISTRMFELVKSDADPAGEEGQAAAKDLWEMVTDFTGGDMSLLPQLMTFNHDKNTWPEEMRKKQEVIDEFMGNALSLYLEKQSMDLRSMGGLDNG